MKYIKKFDNHSQYETFTGTTDFINPNASYCVQENEVHYNPIETRVVAKFNVTDTSKATQIIYPYYGTSKYNEMEIDGVVQPRVVTGYTFSTLGEHEIKYTLVDNTNIENAFTNCSRLISVTIPNSVTSIGCCTFRTCKNLTSVTIGNKLTSIGEYVFESCINLTNIVIPNTVTSIGQSAFENCSGLTSVTIPDSVSSIGNYVFSYCSSLTSVTIEATIPPTLGSSVFTSNASGRKFYVPAESVNVYKTASGWSTYANSIEAIP